jgi:DNA-binding NarL/FixJ family response regulator
VHHPALAGDELTGERWNWDQLSDREKQVALLAVEGKLNRFGIGRELGISFGTIRFHLINIYRVLGIRYGRVQLAFEVGRHWKEIKGREEDK